MRSFQVVLSAIVLLPIAGRAVEADENRLDAPYTVDWRGQSLNAILAELSDQLNVPYILDEAIPPASLNRRIRLSADHLTGRQALRWAARLAGLEAVVREDMVLVAHPSKLPRTWRLTGGTLGKYPPDQEHLVALAERRASVTWIDTPLSGVSRDVSSSFQIDVVFHPDITSEEPLIHFESSEASLDMVRSTLEEQLKAQTAMYDGALWVAPLGWGIDQPASRPSPGVPTSSKSGSPAVSGPLDQFVVLDASVQNWQDFRDRLARATGLACRVTPLDTPYGPTMQARGPAGDVLEAARLVGRLQWKLLPGDGSRPASLEIRPGPADR